MLIDADIKNLGWCLYITVHRQGMCVCKARAAPTQLTDICLSHTFHFPLYNVTYYTASAILSVLGYRSKSPTVPLQQNIPHDPQLKGGVAAKNTQYPGIVNYAEVGSRD